MYWPPCSFFATPTGEQRDLFKITDPDVVLGCNSRQGEGPLYFFVPVEGGAVRVPVCRKHAAWLKEHHGLTPDGHPRPGPLRGLSPPALRYGCGSRPRIRPCTPVARGVTDHGRQGGGTRAARQQHAPPGAGMTGQSPAPNLGFASAEEGRRAVRGTRQPGRRATTTPQGGVMAGAPGTPMARLRTAARRFEGDPKTQYAWHKWAMRFWLVNAVAVVLVFSLAPPLWEKASVLYLVLVSIYANWATEFGAMSAAEAAATEPVSAHARDQAEP